MKNECHLQIFNEIKIKGHAACTRTSYQKPNFTSDAYAMQN